MYSIYPNRFQAVCEQHLGITVNSKNNNYKEIKIRTVANKYYYGLTSILNSKHVPIKSKITL